jgi:hypothetical protein
MSIYDEIRAEREHQQKRWGNEVDDTKNTPWMWAAYIAQYATRWMVGSFMPLGRATTDSFRGAMVKVASIAIAAVESIDRQRAANGSAFYEEQN